MFIQSMGRGSLAHDTGFRIAVAVVAILAILAFRAAFSAYFMLDDFGLLAISRFLDNPFTPFTEDQFPGGHFYRPVGMLVWWLSERMFGAAALAHYVLNLLLHGLDAVVLGLLVKRFCGSRWAGLMVAAAFVLHPIGIGTTLWLSDRFDLLALLFGLLGLHAALQFNRSHDRRWIWATVVLLSLSLLSKEIALAFVAGVGTLWLAAADESPPRARIKRTLFLLLPVAIYPLVQVLILKHNYAHNLISRGDPVHVFLDGTSNWATGWVDYFTFWARLDGWTELLSILAIVMLLMLCLASCLKSWTPARRQAVLAGFAIWLASGLLQWPLLAHFSIRLAEEGSSIDTVMKARHFYASLAGALIMLAALLAPLADSLRGRRWLVVASLALLVPWFAASQSVARRHRIETSHVESMVNAANAAISRLTLPSEGCQIYLLDTDVWSIRWISDEAIKATTPDLAHIEHCLIQTEHTPWYHIAVVDSLDREDLLPLAPNGGATRLSDLRNIGRAKMLILNLDPRRPLPADSRAYFLSWQDGDFVDVTAEVLDGRRRPEFACNRSDAECSR